MCFMPFLSSRIDSIYAQIMLPYDASIWGNKWCLSGKNMVVIRCRCRRRRWRRWTCAWIARKEVLIAVTCAMITHGPHYLSSPVDKPCAALVDYLTTDKLLFLVSCVNWPICSPICIAKGQGFNKYNDEEVVKWQPNYIKSIPSVTSSINVIDL